MNDQTAEQVLSRVPAFLKKIHGSIREAVNVPGDAGERARLRRARRSTDAYAFEATARLFPNVAENRLDDDSQRLIGALAILLAQVRGEVDESAPDMSSAPTAALGLGALAGKEKESGGSARLSRLRFGRMLRAIDADDRLRVFRDLLPLLGIDEPGGFDRQRLATIFLRWHQPRVQFAFARGYFASLKREQTSPNADELQPEPETTA